MPQQRPRSAHFRSDIEGLRAVAVLPILAFHLGVPGVGGGFVGVDVFFVISGFLLTGILLRSGERGAWSLAEFYRRRIVRILPALVAMLLIVLAVGLVWLLPGELIRLGHGTAAAAAMGANIWFWAQTGYFAPLAEGEPLLHSWSLGVEEQFYLLYPVLLLAARRRPAVLLAALAIGSFGLACWWTARDNEAAFYLLPGRAWQLALGGLAATGALRIAGWRGLAAGFGLLLILEAAVWSGELRGWPLVPAGTPATIGALLVILAAPGTRVGGWLATPALRAVGARSYSLYLWHWPPVVLWRLEHGATLTPAATIGLLALTALLAELSYRLVERPGIAWGRAGRPAGRIALGLGAVALTAAAGLVAAHFPRPVPPAVARVAAYAGYDATPERRFQFRTGTCFLEGGGAPAPACVARAADRPNWALIGDSHGAMLWRALAERYPAVNLLQRTAPGCRPLPGGPGKPACVAARDAAFADLAHDPRVTVAILAARWQPADLARLPAAIARLRHPGRRIVVIGPVTEYDGPMPGLLARAMLAGSVARFDRFRLRERAALDARLAAATRGAGATYWSLQTAECPGRCTLTAPGGVPLHSDYGHLTLAGSRLIAARLPPLD